MNKTTSVNGTPLNQNDVAYPCGLIAKSFFTDNYTLYDSSGVNIPINSSNIAWKSDV